VEAAAGAEVAAAVDGAAACGGSAATAFGVKLAMATITKRLASANMVAPVATTRPEGRCGLRAGAEWWNSIDGWKGEFIGVGERWPWGGEGHGGKGMLTKLRVYRSPARPPWRPLAMIPSAARSPSSVFNRVDLRTVRERRSWSERAFIAARRGTSVVIVAIAAIGTAAVAALSAGGWPMSTTRVSAAERGKVVVSDEAKRIHSTRRISRGRCRSSTPTCRGCGKAESARFTGRCTCRPTRASRC